MTEQDKEIHRDGETMRVHHYVGFVEEDKTGCGCISVEREIDGQRIGRMIHCPDHGAPDRLSAAREGVVKALEAWVHECDDTLCANHKQLARAALKELGEASK